MKERGILFSAPMIRALLAGTKTVTRRIVKDVPPKTSAWVVNPERDGKWWPADGYDYVGDGIPCPFGAPGDRLWVREAWRTVESLDELSPAQLLESVPVHYEADRAVRGVFREPTGRYRHARFMPRWASRIMLEVVSVRVERLHEITEDDARREGVDISKPWKMLVNGEPGDVHFFNHRDAFAHLWAAVNGGESWRANPFVWRVEFKRLGAITADEVKAALAKGAEERKAAERTMKRSPRR